MTTMLEAFNLIFGKKWQPTHSHADGGVYKFVGGCRIKGNDGRWTIGVVYETQDGTLCATELQRWEDRFTLLPGVVDPLPGSKFINGE